MTNPFEDDKGSYLVLRNAEQQHSIWPVFVEVPEGWMSTFGPASRQDCLTFIEQTWTDMRPASLIRQMGRDQVRAAPIVERS